jgi:hypothetical protein
MKTALYGVMLSALLAAGCIPKMPFTWPDDGSAEEAAVPVRKHVAPVRPDQVTAENAAQKARELDEELQNDSQAPPNAVGESKK